LILAFFSTDELSFYTVSRVVRHRMLNHTN